MWGKKSLIHCWWECKLVQPLWKSIWRFLKKLKIELPYDLAIPLLGISTKECKSIYKRDTCTPTFIIVHNGQTVESVPRCPTTDESIKKIIYIYISWNITSHKEK
jgi:hypothetical protein